MNIIKKLSLFTFGFIAISFTACGGPSAQDFMCLDSNNVSYNSRCSVVADDRVVLATDGSGFQIKGDLITVTCDDSFQPTAGTICRSVTPENNLDYNSFICPVAAASYANTGVSDASNIFDIAPPRDITFPITYIDSVPGANGCNLVMTW